MNNGNLLAIDPGNVHSAFVVYDGVRPLEFGKWPNESLLRAIKVGPGLAAGECAIETLKPRGMPTSFEEMQTQLWAGRFFEAFFESRCGGEKWALTEPRQVFRHDVKMHVCGNATAKDSNIRRALIDRFGGDDKAIGSVKCKACKGRKLVGLGKARGPCGECSGSGWEHPPGVLSGVAEDVWSALAIAVTHWDKSFATPTPKEPC